MEDIEVGGPLARNFPAPPWANPSSYNPSSYPLFRPASATLDNRVLTIRAVSHTPPSTQQLVAAQANTQSVVQQTPDSSLTVLALAGGEAFLAREYWVQGSDVHCVSAEGEHKIFPLEQLDLYQTASLNKQRNIKFVLQSRDVVEQ
jgi:hypothetical protein